MMTIFERVGYPFDDHLEVILRRYGPYSLSESEAVSDLISLALSVFGAGEVSKNFVVS